MLRIATLCATALLLFVPLPVSAQAGISLSRGELLYTTHCVTCHTSQVHWREKKLVTNWATLQAQVRRWQYNAGLEWGTLEIEDVSRFLNERYYQLSIPVRADAAQSKRLPKFEVKNP